MTKRRYAIIGTGAVGGFYGARLQRAGYEVHYLLNRDYEYVKQNGLVVESVDGDFRLPQVNCYQDAEKMPICDVVIIALKTTQNYLLSKILPLVTRPQSIVLVLQNGLDVEPAIAEIIPDSIIVGGLCFLCSNKAGPGRIQHLDYGQVTLGQYQASYVFTGITEAIEQIAKDFEVAAIPILFEDDLLLARWKKLVWNIPFNGLSVVLNAQTNELITNSKTRNLSKELMFEVVNVAAKYSRIIPVSFVEMMLDYTEKMKPYRTSMKIDYDGQKPMEIETMFGNPLRAAQRVSVFIPKIEMLYQQLKFLESRYSFSAN